MKFMKQILLATVSAMFLLGFASAADLPTTEDSDHNHYEVIQVAEEASEKPTWIWESILDWWNALWAEATTTDANQDTVAPRKTTTKTVTLSENYTATDLCRVSKQDELAVTFIETSGPLLVYVSVWEEGNLIASKGLGLQDTLAVSIDPKKTYDVQARLVQYSDYGTGGKVTFQIAYGYN